MKPAKLCWNEQEAYAGQGTLRLQVLILIIYFLLRQEVEARKSIVTLFLARFTLNDEEVEAMTSRDVPVGTRFFAAMDKTEKIRNDCRVLMSGEDGPTQAG
jgi:hypothetical protein